MKNKLTISQKLEILQKMMAQDNVVMAQCVCIYMLVGYFTDMFVMDIENDNQDKIFDIVDSIITSNSLEEMQLTDAYNDMMDIYKTTLSYHQTVLLAQQFDAINGFIDGMNSQFSNVNVDEMTNQLKASLVELKDLENKTY